MVGPPTSLKKWPLHFKNCVDVPEEKGNTYRSTFFMEARDRDQAFSLAAIVQGLRAFFFYFLVS